MTANCRRFAARVSGRALALGSARTIAEPILDTLASEMVVGAPSTTMTCCLDVD